MTWTLKFNAEAIDNLDRLDHQARSRLLKFLHERLGKRDDPRSLGEPLHGAELGDLWRYRVGDFRIIANLLDREVTILVIRIGHRSSIYR